MIIENYWKIFNYICIVSFIVVDGKYEGYVYMFFGIELIEKLVNGLIK